MGGCLNRWLSIWLSRPLILLLEKLIPDLPVQDLLHRLQVQDVIRSGCCLVEHVANGSLNSRNGISRCRNQFIWRERVDRFIKNGGIYVRVPLKHLIHRSDEFFLGGVEPFFKALRGDTTLVKPNYLFVELTHVQRLWRGKIVGLGLDEMAFAEGLVYRRVGNVVSPITSEPAEGMVETDHFHRALAGLETCRHIPKPLFAVMVFELLRDAKAQGLV